MEIIELRNEKTWEFNEEVFNHKVKNSSHAVVMLHFAT